jgi:hypothetical protein
LAASPVTMKIFSLNCCGLGNPETVDELHNIVRKEDKDTTWNAGSFWSCKTRIWWGIGSSLGFRSHTKY